MRIYLTLIFVTVLACVPHFNARETSTTKKGKNQKNDDVITTIHLVPHSHDDIGWLKSYDGYFWKSVTNSNWNDRMGSVDSILTTMVAALSERSHRRFAWSEFKYFEMWWKMQKEYRRNQVRKLLDSKQLEFVNGGWSSHDEACPTFQDMIVNLKIGHEFILKEFGQKYIPRISWQLDEFGHSVTNAMLQAEIGMDAMFFARIAKEERYWRIDNQELEFIWKPTPDTELFCHVERVHYDSPTYLRFKQPDETLRAAPIVDDPESDQHNVDTLTETFMNNVTNWKVMAGDKSNLMVIVGDDFAWENAFYDFQQLDALINYMNTNEKYKNDYFIKYSTPGEYIAALYENKHKFKVTKTMHGDKDFFPYDDGNQTKPEMWTGYFTTRPMLKKGIRNLVSQYYQSQQTYAIVHLQTSEFDQEILNATKVMEDAIGILLHHDAITGTSPKRVIDHYYTVLQKAQDIDQEIYLKVQSNLYGWNYHAPGIQNDKWQKLDDDTSALIPSNHSANEFYLLLSNPTPLKISQQTINLPLALQNRSFDFYYLKKTDEQDPYFLLQGREFLQNDYQERSLLAEKTCFRQFNDREDPGEAQLMDDTIKCTVRFQVDIEANGGVVLVKAIDYGEQNITESDLQDGVKDITDVLNKKAEAKMIKIAESKTKVSSDNDDFFLNTTHSNAIIDTELYRIKYEGYYWNSSNLRFSLWNKTSDKVDLMDIGVKVYPSFQNVTDGEDFPGQQFQYSGLYIFQPMPNVTEGQRYSKLVDAYLFPKDQMMTFNFEQDNLAMENPYNNLTRVNTKKAQVQVGLVNFTRELDYPTIKLDVKLDSLPEVNISHHGYEVVLDVKVHGFNNNKTFYTDSNGLRMIERVVATGDVNEMTEEEKKQSPYYKVSQGPGYQVQENYYPVGGIIMMYDIKNLTDEERMLLKEQPVQPGKYVNIQNAKKIFRAFFGDALGEIELETLIVLADKNDNKKIEIEELTNFLKEYKQHKNILGPQEQEDKIKEVFDEQQSYENDFYWTIASDQGRAVRKLVVMNDRAQGGTAIKQDTIQLMQQRRMKAQDEKGVVEGLDDVDEVGAGNRVNCTYFIQLIDLEDVQQPELVDSSQRQLQQVQLNKARYYFQPINQSQIVQDDKSDKLNIHPDLQIVKNTDKDLKIVLWPTIKNDTNGQGKVISMRVENWSETKEKSLNLTALAPNATSILEVTPIGTPLRDDKLDWGHAAKRDEALQPLRFRTYQLSFDGEQKKSHLANNDKFWKSQAPFNKYWYEEAHFSQYVVYDIDAV